MIAVFLDYKEMILFAVFVGRKNLFLDCIDRGIGTINGAVHEMQFFPGPENEECIAFASAIFLDESDVEDIFNAFKT